MTLSHKTISTILLTVLLSVCSGCLNIMQHAHGNTQPFEGCDSICQMCSYDSWMILPGILMFPFELVGDIITLPYDAFAK